MLALDTIRLVAELGGRLERDLRSAVIPIASRDALLERIDMQTLHAGPRECLDSAAQLAQEVAREVRVPVSPGAPRDKRDRRGRLAVRRRPYKNASGATSAELELRVLTRPGMPTITTSDGVSATTRRLVAEQAVGELRAMKRARAKVTLAAGARRWCG